MSIHMSVPSLSPNGQATRFFRSINMMISPPEPCGPGGEDREEKILQIANGNCQLVLNDETFPGEFPQKSP